MPRIHHAYQYIVDRHGLCKNNQFHRYSTSSHTTAIVTMDLNHLINFYSQYVPGLDKIFKENQCPVRDNLALWKGYAKEIMDMTSTQQLSSLQVWISLPAGAWSETILGACGRSSRLQSEMEWKKAGMQYYAQISYVLDSSSTFFFFQIGTMIRPNWLRLIRFRVGRSGWARGPWISQTP